MLKTRGRTRAGGNVASPLGLPGPRRLPWVAGPRLPATLDAGGDSPEYVRIRAGDQQPGKPACLAMQEQEGGPASGAG